MICCISGPCISYAVTVELLQKMAANEIKLDQAASSDSIALTQHLASMRKRMHLTKQELVRKVDKWGGQLPIRLLTSILEHSSAKQIASSQAVCKSWRLAQNLVD